MYTHVHTQTHHTSVHKHMNISTLSYAQIQWEFHVVKFAEHYCLVQLEMTDVVWVEISPMMRNMNSTPKNIHVRQYKNKYTPTHVHTHTHTPSHIHRLTWTLQYLPVQSPCRLPTMIAILWLVMRDGGWLEIMHLRTTNVLPLPQTWLWWWTQVNLRRWILNWVRIRNTLTLFRFVYL